MSLHESFDFSEKGIGIAKIAFSSLKDFIVDGYIWLTFWVWGNIFCQLFSLWLFLLGQREKYTGQKLTETQSVKTQVKSGEIPIHKKVGKMKQNVDSCRLTPNLTCYPILKIQSRENTRKDLKISKTGMADRWVLVQVKKIYQLDTLDKGLHSVNISDIWFFGQVGCRTCDMGPYKWLHRHLWVCKNLYSAVSKGWESNWLKFSTKAKYEVNLYAKMCTSNLCQYWDGPYLLKWGTAWNDLKPAETTWCYL